MPARNGFRRRLKLLPVAALATVAATATSAAAQAPGLPRTFNATRIDSPTPVGGGAFGWGLWSADLTGDGKHDLLVPQAQIGTETDPNKIFIFNGVTGAHIDTIVPPEDNPRNVTATNPSGYVSPEMGFTYVETMPDIGSCPGGDTTDADKICNDPTVGPKDNIPEILVGSRALKVNKDNGALPPTNDDRPTGRAYVIDGATRVVLKRIDMPVADRRQVAFFSASPQFGRTTSSPQALPPCAGPRAEANDAGVGPCPALTRGTANTTTGSATLTNVDLPDAQNGQMIVGPGIPLGARITSVGPGTLTFAAPGTPAPTATATATGVAVTASDFHYPQAVRIGDLDGGGQPDIVITARSFPEAGNVLLNDAVPASPGVPAVPATPVPDATATTPGDATAPPGTHCRASTQTQAAATTANPNPALPSCSAGKVWTYRGEDIVGSNPATILDTTMNPRCLPTPLPAGTTQLPNCTPTGGIQNPDAQASPAGGEFGGNLFRVGDLAGDDGIPDFVIPFRTADIPLRGSPDVDAGLNMGVAYLFNGRTGAMARRIVSPEPQIRSQFSGNFNSGRAVGDLGATSTPDILLPAALQNLTYTDQGRLWVFNGDTTAGGGAEQGWQFAMLNDPEPHVGGNFGGAITGVGDLVEGRGAPANEVLVGGYRFDPYTEATQSVVPDVNFMSATYDKNLMTVPHPEGTPGDGFGVGITPMGDLNNDGFLDFAVSAYLANGVQGGQGRAWIFKSDNSAPPPPPTQAAAVATGPAAAATAATEAAPSLKAGSCTNRTVGTEQADTLRGTLAGDEIFGFGGDDRVTGFQGRDCLDGGRGNDRMSGGDDNDKQIGGHGRDRLTGGDGRDNLYGGTSNDRLDGGTDRDMLAGGSASDDLIGGSGDDRLFGEAGTDRLVAGGGRNQIDGGTGNDSIEARNGERDRIICGTGRDRVRADRYDRLNGCEVVSFGGKITRRGVLPPRAVTAARAAG